MKKKALLINVLLTIAIIALVIAAILLMIDRTSAKSFPNIVPNGELFESCQIVCADGAKVLTDSELDSLMDKLGQLQYYNRGSYDNVMEGNIYSAFFTSQQTGSVEVHISDTGKIYTHSTCYEFAPGTDPRSICSYLEALFDAE